MFGSSQGFSFGGVDATQEVQKSARVEEKQTCVPVTVRILEDAVKSRSDDASDILIHGAEAGVVHLVGVVESLVQQTAMTEFQLNDASGRMKIRHYSSSTGAAERLTVGSYVSVIGNVRSSPTVHLSAMCLSSVKSADEISYHMIEVAHAALRLRNPAAASAPKGLSMATGVVGTPSPTKSAFVSSSAISPPKVELNFNEPAMLVMAQPAVKVDLRSSVLQLLQQEQEKAGEEGLALASIVVKLAHCQASSDKVKDMLAGLVNEGEVYNTIDDNHFSVF